MDGKLVCCFCLLLGAFTLTVNFHFPTQGFLKRDDCNPLSSHFCETWTYANTLVIESAGGLGTWVTVRPCLRCWFFFSPRCKQDTKHSVGADDRVGCSYYRECNPFNCEQNCFKGTLVLLHILRRKYSATLYMDYSCFLWISVTVIHCEHCTAWITL